MEPKAQQTSCQFQAATFASHRTFAHHSDPSTSPNVRVFVSRMSPRICPTIFIQTKSLSDKHVPFPNATLTLSLVKSFRHLTGSNRLAADSLNPTSSPARQGRNQECPFLVLSGQKWLIKAWGTGHLSRRLEIAVLPRNDDVHVATTNSRRDFPCIGINFQPSEPQPTRDNHQVKPIDPEANKVSKKKPLGYPHHQQYSQRSIFTGKRKKQRETNGC